VLTRVLQQAVDEQMADRTAYNNAAAELGILLAEVLQGEWLSPFQDVADCGTTIIVAALASCAATVLPSNCTLGASRVTRVHKCNAVCCMQEVFCFVQQSNPTLLACYRRLMYAGKHWEQLVDEAVQQRSSARALESSIRCWVHMHAAQPGCLPEPHQALEQMQRVAGLFGWSEPKQAPALSLAEAAAGAAAKPLGVFTSSEYYALSVTCLKACGFAAAERVAPHAGSGSGASSSSSSSVASHKRVTMALGQALLTASAALAACSSLNMSNCSSKALMLPAWQLLLAHSLHATGQLLLILHADGVLPPAPVEQHALHPTAGQLLVSLQAAIAAVPAQLATAVQAPAAAAAAAQGKSQKVDPCASLLQQQEALSRKVWRIARTPATSSSSRSSSSAGYEGTAALPLCLKAAVSAELAQQLVDFAAALSGCFPAKLCCNAPGCSSLLKFSELEAVGGKSCMCARCKTAR
jgi:hypothetical protein